MPSLVREAAFVFAIALGINFPWEMAQSYLYAPMGTWVEASWECFVASVGDGAWVLLILSAGWVSFRRRRWFASPGWRGYALMLGAGFLIAVAVEWAALAAGRWSYSEAMPMLPGTNLGLVPVVQMMLLPPLAFRLAARATRS